MSESGKTRCLETERGGVSGEHLQKVEIPKLRAEDAQESNRGGAV